MSAELNEGTLFANRYRVIRRIASGGMGAVYEVEHLETERRRALKVMHPHLFQNDDLRDRFKREAKVAARVDSEFIVDVFDAGVDEATEMPFLVMELLRGEELGKRVKRLGTLPPTEVVGYLHQVAQALDKTHQVSIIHRDLKPDNVFLLERADGMPRVKVLDYGIAKVLADGATGASTSHMMGTPLYMAPEQFNPSARLTPAADVYALGMMAYTCLVGGAYWAEEAKGGNIYALVSVAIHGPQDPASVRAAQRGVVLPAAFDTWFAKTTAVDAQQRFPSASTAVVALAEALGVLLPPRVPSVSLSGSNSETPSSAAVVQLSPSANTPAVLHADAPPVAGSRSAPIPEFPDTTAPGATATHAVLPKQGISGSQKLAIALGAMLVSTIGILLYVSVPSRPSPTSGMSDPPVGGTLTAGSAPPTAAAQVVSVTPVEPAIPLPSVSVLVAPYGPASSDVSLKFGGANKPAQAPIKTAAKTPIGSQSSTAKPAPSPLPNPTFVRD